MIPKSLKSQEKRRDSTNLTVSMDLTGHFTDVTFINFQFGRKRGFRWL